MNIMQFNLCRDIGRYIFYLFKEKNRFKKNFLKYINTSKNGLNSTYIKMICKFFVCDAMQYFGTL